MQEVCTQIWATLYDYPGLKSCDGLIKYIKECVRTAWGLTNQVSCHTAIHQSPVLYCCLPEPGLLY